MSKQITCKLVFKSSIKTYYCIKTQYKNLLHYGDSSITRITIMPIWDHLQLNTTN